MNEPPRRGWMDRVGVNVVLNALVILVSLTAWAVTIHNQTDTDAIDLRRLDKSMTDKIADLREATMGGLAEVRAQIAVLPDQRARIDILERRAADLDTRVGSIGAVVAAQAQSDAQSRADINVLLRTLNQPLMQRQR
jgi:hypothetical protein